MDIDNEWQQFLQQQHTNPANGQNSTDGQSKPGQDAVTLSSVSMSKSTISIMPKCEELYISTKTKVLFLSYLKRCSSIYYTSIINDSCFLFKILCLS